MDYSFYKYFEKIHQLIKEGRKILIKQKQEYFLFEKPNYKNVKCMPYYIINSNFHIQLQLQYTRRKCSKRRRRKHSNSNNFFPVIFPRQCWEDKGQEASKQCAQKHPGFVTSYVTLGKSWRSSSSVSSFITLLKHCCDNQ